MSSAEGLPVEQQGSKRPDRKPNRLRRRLALLAFLAIGPIDLVGSDTAFSKLDTYLEHLTDGVGDTLLQRLIVDGIEYSAIFSYTLGTVTLVSNSKTLVNVASDYKENRDERKQNSGGIGKSWFWLTDDVIGPRANKISSSIEGRVANLATYIQDSNSPAVQRFGGFVKNAIEFDLGGLNIPIIKAAKDNPATRSQRVDYSNGFSATYVVGSELVRGLNYIPGVSTGFHFVAEGFNYLTSCDFHSFNSADGFVVSALGVCSVVAGSVSKQRERDKAAPATGTLPTANPGGS